MLRPPTCAQRNRNNANTVQFDIVTNKHAKTYSTHTHNQATWTEIDAEQTVQSDPDLAFYYATRTLDLSPKKRHKRDGTTITIIVVLIVVVIIVMMQWQ